MTRSGFGGSWTAGSALVLVAALFAPAVARAEEGAGDMPPEALVTSAAASSDRSGVTVRVSRGPAGLEVEGHCQIPVSRAMAWSVLTDYDGIDGFVSSMRESRISGRRDGDVLVEQVAVGRLLLFTRRLHVTLRVHEEPPGRIRFEDILKRDFESYRGEWRIEEQGNEVEIVYRVQARPTFAVPDFVARGMFAKTVRELLTQVQAEIQRRANLAGRQAE